MIKVIFSFINKRVLLFILLVCIFSPDLERPFAQEVSPLHDEPIQPLPLQLKLNTQKVKLGEQLFHEKKLSKNNSISCASCHSLNKAGTDNLRFSKGIHGAIGDMNSPTVFNSFFNFRQFWDGRAKSLEDQIDGPISHPKEMGSNWKEIIQKLKSDPTYVAIFKKNYPDGVTKNNIKNAIANFEKSLISPNSRFDQYLRGNLNAISKREKKGYTIFKNYGCISCHQGINVGGNMFQKFGVIEKHSKTPQNKLFKVPSLRNIALTYPYFHDGSAKNLRQAVKVMAKYQLGRVLSENEILLIVDFLKTLTGNYKGKPLNEIQ